MCRLCGNSPDFLGLITPFYLLLQVVLINATKKGGDGSETVMSVFNLNNRTINNRMDDFDNDHIVKLSKAANFVLIGFLGIIHRSAPIIGIGVFLTFLPLGVYYIIHYFRSISGVNRIFVTGRVLFASLLTVIIWLVILPMEYLANLLSAAFLVEPQLVVFQIVLILVVSIILLYLLWSELIYPRLLSRSRIDINYDFLKINHSFLEFFLSVVLIPSILIRLFIQISFDVEWWVISQTITMCALAIVLFISYEPIRHEKRFSIFVMSPACVAILLVFESNIRFLVIGPLLILGSLIALTIWSPKEPTRREIQAMVEIEQQRSSEEIQKLRILRQTRPIGYFIVYRLLNSLLVLTIIILFIPFIQFDFLVVSFVILFGFVYAGIEHQFSNLAGL